MADNTEARAMRRFFTCVVADLFYLALTVVRTLFTLSPRRGGAERRGGYR